MIKLPSKWIGPLLLLALTQITAFAQNSPLTRDQYVEAAVVGEMSHIQPGTPYRVGLLLRHDKDWHTYWKSTATGYATSIKWDLPEGFEVTDLSWPTPEVFNFFGFSEYVYGGEALLVATLLPSADLVEGAVKIGFSAEWLMCENVCIPGGISGSFTLPVQNSPASPSPEWKPYFDEADRAFPSTTDTYSFTAWPEGQDIVLQVDGARFPDALYFFDQQAVFEPWADSLPLQENPGPVQLRLRLAEGTDVPPRIMGVLKAEPGWPDANESQSFVVDIPVTTKPDRVLASDETSWTGILLLAFIGGLILNLMPCVFPVLGIKIMGFVSQAGESRGKVIAHGLIFSAGVLISFWILAGVLLVLRSGGSQLGWGFQLQSPGFVLILTMLLFAFGLNLSGLFEVGQKAVGVGSKLTAKSGLKGSFFSGVLATVVATPCAAPFLAPALGVALALPAAGSLLVFTFIAVGLATPYLLFSIFPGLMKWLPRPGAWMETFKQSMAFLLYATVAYLIWVLAGQLTDEGGYSVFSFLQVLLSLVFLALSLWVYGRWAAFHKPKRTRFIAVTAATVILMGALATGLTGTSKAATGPNAVKWEKWGPGKAEALAQDGRFVYVDFTARWCVTCQTNKATVFTSKQVLEQLAALDVVLLKADWTHQDAQISQALASFNRSAVPFNLIYGPGKDKPIILPEILTPGIVLEALTSATIP